MIQGEYNKNRRRNEAEIGVEGLSEALGGIQWVWEHFPA